jgi:predicted nucleic acid-binding protein
VILVDSSVWIDYFNGMASLQTDRLDALLGAEPLAIGDIIMTEVLQGFSSERHFRQARSLLSTLEPVQIGGHDIAVAAAENFRKLRARGITIRKTIDTLIATRCIYDDLTLLHCDKDFEPFAEHLGLKIL